jgi:hypothetical protein
MHIKNQDFDAFIDDVTKALDKFGVQGKEKEDLLRLFEAMRGDVVQPGK